MSFLFKVLCHDELECSNGIRTECLLHRSSAPINLELNPEESSAQQGLPTLQASVEQANKKISVHPTGEE